MCCRGVLPVRSLVGMAAVVGLYLIWLNLVPGAASASPGPSYNFKRPTIGSLMLNVAGSQMPYIPLEVVPGAAPIVTDPAEGYSMAFVSGGSPLTGETLLDGLITMRLDPDEVTAGNPYEFRPGDEFYLVWSGPAMLGETLLPGAALEYGPDFKVDLPTLAGGLEWGETELTSQYVRAWIVPDPTWIAPDPVVPVVPEPQPPAVPEPEPDPPAVPAPDPPAVPAPDPPVVPAPDPPVLPAPDPPVLPAPDPPVLPAPDPPVVRAPDPPVVRAPDPPVVRAPDPPVVRAPDPPVLPAPDPPVLPAPDPPVVPEPAPPAVPEEVVGRYTPCASASYNFNRPTIGSLVINLMGSDVPYIPSVVDVPAGDVIKVDNEEGYSMVFAAFEGGGTTTLNGLITLRYHPEEVAAGNQYQIEAGDEFWLVWAGPGKIFETSFDAATLAYGPGFGLDLPDLTQLGLEWAPPEITSQHVRVWTVPGPDPPAVPEPVVREPDPPAVPEPQPPAVPEPNPPAVPEPEPPAVPEPEPPAVPEPDPPAVPELDPPAVSEPDPPVLLEPDPPAVSDPDLLLVPDPDLLLVREVHPWRIYRFDPGAENPWVLYYDAPDGDVPYLLEPAPFDASFFGMARNPGFTFLDRDSAFNSADAFLAGGLTWPAALTASGEPGLLDVPEPGTLVLLITGGLGLLLVRRRKTAGSG